MSPAAFLRLEWLLSLALTLLSIAWAAARGLPLAASLAPTPRSRARDGRRRRALGHDSAAAPLGGDAPEYGPTFLLPFSRTARAPATSWSSRLLSGFTEELFFRGVLLPEMGLVLSSLCFGALHALCLVYFVWATVIGAGLATLALAGGSLVTPIAAHATYNLGALLLLRRLARAHRHRRSRHADARTSRLRPRMASVRNRRCSFVASLPRSCSSCSARLSGTSPRLTAEQYYNEGKDAFSDENHEVAIKSYKELLDQYPLDPHAEEAELTIAES